MSGVWNTKYGTRRVRFDPPTLKEAIFAARGLTDELQQQAEIAASLMELPLEAVRAELLKGTPPRGSAQIVTDGRQGTARTVVVERKRSRVRRPRREPCGLDQPNDREARPTPRCSQRATHSAGWY